MKFSEFIKYLKKFLKLWFYNDYFLYALSSLAGFCFCFKWKTNNSIPQAVMWSSYCVFSIAVGTKDKAKHKAQSLPLYSSWSGMNGGWWIWLCVVAHAYNFSIQEAEVEELPWVSCQPRLHDVSYDNLGYGLLPHLKTNKQ